MQKDNVKFKIILLGMFLFGIFGLAKTSWGTCETPCIKSGTVWTCTDISRDCVQDAVIASEAAWSATNEIRLVAGEVTWADPGGTNYCSYTVDYTAAMCLHRGVKLTGGYGGGVTKVTLTGPNVSGAILYYANSTARDANEAFEFSGFTIDMNGILTNGSGFLVIANSGYPTAIYPHGRLMTGMKIHDNIFQNGGYETIGINGAVTGVAYNNTFINVETAIRGEGADYTWNLLNGSPIPYGSGDAFYFEDNVIKSSVNREFGGWTAGQGFPGIVTRYNTIDMTNSTAQQILDLHGLQSMTSASDGSCNSSCSSSGVCYTTSCCEQWSQMKAEIYGNIWTNYGVSNPLEWMRHRGSWMMMFNNTITGTATAGSINYYQYSCDSCQRPASPAFSQHVQNTYVWNNTANGNARPYVKLADLCADNVAGAPYTITANTDYWNYNANSLNGSTQKGINCGNAAPTSNCSIGDGYWQTSYTPCSAPPTTMADMKTYTQAAKFYKCTASNAWTLYYQPYSYPHPLRLTDPSDTTPPSAPTGLTVR